MIRWITERLGTAAWERAHDTPEVCILDVRELVDRDGNPNDAVREKIDQAVELLRQGERVVVCCDYGMSRSNGIAAGALALYENVSLDAAIRRVLETTGEQAIRIEVLSSVRRALGDGSGGEAAGKGTSVVLTGASGFLGSHVAVELQKTQVVHAPTRTEVPLDGGSLPLDLLVKATSPRCVVHLAHPRVITTNDSFGTSLTMLKNVLDVCRENGTPLVYLSSWEVFSSSPELGWRPDDDSPPCPGWTYGLAKAYGEDLIRVYERNHGVRATIVRASPIFGPTGRVPRFIWNFIAKARAGADIVAHQYTNGFPRLDLLFVSDAVRAIVTAIDRLPGGIINIGSGELVSTTSVARWIVDRLESSSQIRHITIDRNAPDVLMRTDRAASVLGWRPLVRWEDGLKQMVEASLHRDANAK